MRPRRPRTWWWSLAAGALGACESQQHTARTLPPPALAAEPSARTAARSREANSPVQPGAPALAEWDAGVVPEVSCTGAELDLDALAATRLTARRAQSRWGRPPTFIERTVRACVPGATASPVRAADRGVLFQLEAHAEPPELAPGQSAIVRLSLRNVSPDKLTLRLEGCAGFLLELHALTLNGERADVLGAPADCPSEPPCAGKSLEITLLPGGVAHAAATYVPRVRAGCRGQAPQREADLAPGDYRLSVRSSLLLQDDPTGLRATVTTALRMRAP